MSTEKAIEQGFEVLQKQTKDTTEYMFAALALAATPLKADGDHYKVAQLKLIKLIVNDEVFKVAWDCINIEGQDDESL